MRRLPGMRRRRQGDHLAWSRGIAGIGLRRRLIEVRGQHHLFAQQCRVNVVVPKVSEGDGRRIYGEWYMVMYIFRGCVITMRNRK